MPIYEVYSQGTTHYLVMEFVEGRNLRDFVKIRKKLEPPEATKLMIDIASGLRYAFEHGLTHRDLKMTNVLVTSMGRAKLVDFGLAAIDEALDEILPEVPTNARTIDYAALERATGVRKDDTRSDIYFLGCIYYHMLAGVPPLAETRDRVQRLNKTRFLDVVPLQQLDAGIPHYVALVANKAMMLDVNRRYQTPAAALADLELAARRLAVEGAGGDMDPRERERLAAMLVRPEDQRTVMIVESNVRMQDLLREGLKKAGYRVLVISDPERAISRLYQDASAAECVLLNAQEIGQAALNVFNQFAEDQRTSETPAVLLLDEPQRAWAAEAKTDERRVVLHMPITMKQLRATLSALLPARQNAAGPDQG